MHKPRIFISAVSSEYQSLRKLVAEILTRLGYDPVLQDIFGTDPGDLRHVLREKIDSCDGVLQIVGAGYGAEPPTVDEAFGRVSYTQFELLYGQQQGKKTWVIIPGEACTRDKPTDQLDLPRAPDHYDPAGYQQEHQELQQAYIARLKASGHLRHSPGGDDAFQLSIERLRDDFTELRRGFKLWQRWVAAALLLVVVLGPSEQLLSLETDLLCRLRVS